MKIGIIISTYNHPEWLEKVFWGYLHQSKPADEIVIADDGSDEKTKNLIHKYSQLLPIVHVWHEDNGFQKSRILNKAVVKSSADYLIFTDQDCIPRFDFVETHAKLAKKNYFLSGGYFKLPMDLSKNINSEDVISQNCFNLKWLTNNGLKLNFKCTKLVKNSVFTKFMNFITPTKATWNGCNASGWKTDIVTANGFNETMQYGGQDREFGERLFNMGIKSKQIRYSAIVVHLDHKRPYKTKASIDKNIQIRKETRKNKVIVTPSGINEL